ncbi:hypothetical protein KDX16_25350 [Burkholderia vietnamiensis]|uniref:hypothetical protein n=1 Tax=Burkholderia vietnamiensis TaxID=60552 RepID=UPI0012D86EF1|nr:hypothetical protein [Burkholderia vietnamiensis]MBR7919125.1 hypothetical protein [Burkholderia vietnamiensis]HDR9200837.1 hypothetical protein [Burkholderia vietnamiensis]HDR9360058.1 hypothetical protein [Burkholderia vietnamiensis]
MLSIYVASFSRELIDLNGGSVIRMARIGPSRPAPVSVQRARLQMQVNTSAFNGFMLRRTSGASSARAHLRARHTGQSGPP